MRTFIKPEYTTWNKEYDCPNLPWRYFKVDVKTLDISNILKLNINLD